jgi:hypothetical protein
MKELRFTKEERESLRAAIVFLEKYGCTPHPAEEIRQMLDVIEWEEKSRG